MSLRGKRRAGLVRFVSLKARKENKKDYLESSTDSYLSQGNEILNLVLKDEEIEDNPPEHNKQNILENNSKSNMKSPKINSFTRRTEQPKQEIWNFINSRRKGNKGNKGTNHEHGNNNAHAPKHESITLKQYFQHQNECKSRNAPTKPNNIHNNKSFDNHFPTTKSPTNPPNPPNPPDLPELDNFLIQKVARRLPGGLASRYKRRNGYMEKVFSYGVSNKHQPPKPMHSPHAQGAAATTARCVQLTEEEKEAEETREFLMLEQMLKGEGGVGDCGDGKCPLTNSKINSQFDFVHLEDENSDIMRRKSMANANLYIMDNIVSSSGDIDRLKYNVFHHSNSKHVNNTKHTKSNSQNNNTDASKNDILINKGKRFTLPELFIPIDKRKKQEIMAKLKSQESKQKSYIMLNGNTVKDGKCLRKILDGRTKANENKRNKSCILRASRVKNKNKQIVQNITPKSIKQTEIPLPSQPMRFGLDFHQKGGRNHLKYSQSVDNYNKLRNLLENNKIVNSGGGTRGKLSTTKLNLDLFQVQNEGPDKNIASPSVARYKVKAKADIKEGQELLKEIYSKIDQLKVLSSADDELKATKNDNIHIVGENYKKWKFKK